MLSYDGEATVNGSTRVDIVKTHVNAIYSMINKKKNEEIEERKKQAMYNDPIRNGESVGSEEVKAQLEAGFDIQALSAEQGRSKVFNIYSFYYFLNYHFYYLSYFTLFNTIS